LIINFSIELNLIEKYLNIGPGRQSLGGLESISPTYLCAAFMCVAPKSVRILLSCVYLFTVVRSTGAKAKCRILMKLTPEATARQNEVSCKISTKKAQTLDRKE